MLSARRGSIKKIENPADSLKEKVILIQNIKKQELFSLFVAFDINTLMMHEMEAYQKCCKVVPYTNASYNKKNYLGPLGE